MARAIIVLAAAFALACGGSASSQRDAALKEKLQAWGNESFPDDSEVRWKFVEASHRGDYSVVTAEPDSARVGYAKARFVVSFAKPDEPDLIACLALDGKKWTQLFEDTDAPPDWREKAGLQR